MTDIIFTIVIIFFLITFVFLIAIITIKLYIKKIKEINQKEIDHQKSLKLSVVETQEQVLQNISQELHDDAGQQLTFINFQLENLKLDSKVHQEVLDPISNSVSQLSATIRELSHTLNNQVFSQKDLLKTIEIELNKILINKKIQVVFHQEKKGEKEFSDDEKIILYRIFQEIINNILKHAKATKINVTVVFKPKFSIALADNGIGFDTSILSNTNGISNIRKRAELIDYSVLIDSEIGKGCCITLLEN